VASGVDPDLARDAAGHVYLAFANRFAGNDDIYFSRWSEGGWSPPQNISETAGASGNPRLAVGADGQVAVVWAEEVAGMHLIFLARTANGLDWSLGPVPDAQGGHPVVALDSLGNLWVAWQDALDLGLPLVVFCSRWTGSQWMLPTAFSASLMADAALPAMAADREKIGLAWQEGTAVWLVEWTGSAWGTPAQCSGAEAALAPALTWGEGDGIHLAWATNDGVTYCFRPAAGFWQPAEAVAGGQASPAGVRIAAGAVAHAIWLAVDSGGVRGLYYSEQTVIEPSATPSVSATGNPVPAATATSSPTATLTPVVGPTATRSPAAAHRACLPSILAGS